MGTTLGKSKCGTKGTRAGECKFGPRQQTGGGGMDHISGPAAWTEGVQEPDVSRQTLLVRPGPETLKAKAR